jgi:beta-phosphoglucomutase
METALIFDFDGVIADTEPLHWRAYREVAREYGIDCSWDSYRERYIGYDDRDLFRHGFADGGRAVTDEELPRLIEAKALAFTHGVEREEMRPYPGVSDLVHEAAAAQVPLALCSGALKSDVIPLLRRFGLLDFFDVLSTAEDVPASKPDPAPYRHALARLRDKRAQRIPLDVSRCVAIEDTPAGVQSAQAAGLSVIAVTTTHEAESLRSANRIVKSLDEVNLDFVAALCCGDAEVVT